MNWGWFVGKFARRFGVRFKGGFLSRGREYVAAAGIRPPFGRLRDGRDLAARPGVCGFSVCFFGNSIF